MFVGMTKLAGQERLLEPFAIDARQAMHGLRGALRDVIDRLPSPTRWT